MGAAGGGNAAAPGLCHEASWRCPRAAARGLRGSRTHTHTPAADGRRAPTNGRTRCECRGGAAGGVGGGGPWRRRRPASARTGHAKRGHAGARRGSGRCPTRVGAPIGGRGPRQSGWRRHRPIQAGVTVRRRQTGGTATSTPCRGQAVHAATEVHANLCHWRETTERKGNERQTDGEPCPPQRHQVREATLRCPTAIPQPIVTAQSKEQTQSKPQDDTAIG